jgi:hypothetical protein
VQDASALVALQLAQAPDILIGFVHQNQGIPVCRDPGAGRVVVL